MNSPTVNAALALTLAACAGPPINREEERLQKLPANFAISNITTPIPWVVRDPVEKRISFKWISSLQFTERTSIRDLQLGGIFPEYLTGFEIVGAVEQSDRSTLVCVDLLTVILDEKQRSLWAITFSPQGQFVSMSNLPLEDLIPLFMQRGKG